MTKENFKNINKLSAEKTAKLLQNFDENPMTNKKKSADLKGDKDIFCCWSTVIVGENKRKKHKKV